NETGGHRGDVVVENSGHVRLAKIFHGGDPVLGRDVMKNARRITLADVDDNLNVRKAERMAETVGVNVGTRRTAVDDEVNPKSVSGHLLVLPLTNLSQTLLERTGQIAHRTFGFWLRKIGFHLRNFF